MAIIDQIVIADVGGTQADVTAGNALKVDNSAVTQPVSGTITANIGTIAGLATEATLATIAGTVAGTELQVDVLTLPAITGTVTANAGTNLNTSLLALESGGNLAAILSDTTDIEAAVELIDDTVVVLGTDTYTEAASKGLIIGGVRRDADTTLVNTTNEFAPFQLDANGRLKVEAFSGETLPVSLTSTTITGTVAVTQSGTWDEVGINDSGNSITVDGTVSVTGVSTLAEQQTQTTHLATIAGDTTDIETAVELIDDTVVVLGTATYTEAASKGIVIGGVRRDADTTLVDTTNEFAPFQLDANGRLKVEAFSGEALPVTLTSTTITGTVAVTQSGTWDEVGINDSGNSITVDAVNLDIRDLVAASDAVSVHGDVGVLSQFNLTNSNPASVAIVDGNGDQITSFGGGTQYTEDAVAAANPVGTAVNLIRSDTPAGITTTDGDNVAQRGTDFGAAYVQVVSSTGSFVDTFGGGTQYSDGDANADPTGTVAMGTDGSNVFALHTDTSGDLQVDILTLPTVTIQDGGNTITVDGTVAVTGVSTLAEQQTQTTHLATIAGDTTDIEAAVELLDDTVYVDDADWTDDTSKHLLVGGVYQSAPHTVTDGDVTPFLTDVNGRLATIVSGTVAVSNAGLTELAAAINGSSQMDVNIAANGIGLATAANQTTIIGHVDGIEGLLTTIDADTGSILTSVQLIDDAAVVLGTATYTEATSTGLAIGAVRRDADTTLVGTTNEWGPLQMDANGRLKVEVFSGETLPVSLTDASVVVLGTATYTEATSSGQVMGAVRRDANTTLVGTTNEFAPLQVNAIGGLKVAADLAVPVNVQIGNATLAAGVIDETGASAVDALAVGGGTAHDAVDSGNPVKVGGVAVSGSATPTSVASGDRTRFIANQHGIPYGIGGHPNLITREYDFGTSAQTDVNLAAAAVAADERIYITRFEALCDNANTVAVSVRAGFGTANVPSASSSGVSGMIASHPGIAAGSGIMSGNGAGILAVGGVGEEPRITTSAATSGNLHVIISYFLIDETP